MTDEVHTAETFHHWRNALTTGDYLGRLSDMNTRVKPSQQVDLHRLLSAQYSAPGRTVTAGQLAHLAEVAGGMSVVNLKYGRLARLFCESMIPTDNKLIELADHQWWPVWSDGQPSPNGFLWTMRPQVAEALELLGWVSPAATRMPEEVVITGNFVEGAVRRVVVNAYERDAKARQACINHYGVTCVICGFNFGLAFGADVADFIHVHHLRPLSEIGEEYEIDPIADLRPVCPNCHAMIHYGGITRSIEDVKSLLNPKLRDSISILNSAS